MKIHDEEFEDLLVQSVTIDDENLSSEFSRVSSDVAYWSRRLARLEADLIRAKAALKKVEADGYCFAMEHLTNATGKRPTQKYLEAYVETMPEVQEAHEAIARVTEARTEARGYVDAISAKRDMLVQLGANRRQELKASLID